MTTPNDPLTAAMATMYAGIMDTYSKGAGQGALELLGLAPNPAAPAPVNPNPTHKSIPGKRTFADPEWSHGPMTQAQRSAMVLFDALGHHVPADVVLEVQKTAEGRAQIKTAIIELRAQADDRKTEKRSHADKWARLNARKDGI